jgi:dihydrodipicolinate synthase/N-acetylneuraminate lyase
VQLPLPARPSVVVALLTPIADDGTIDVGALREHVAFLVEAGVDALMPCGTTGEGPLLEEDEVATVVEAAVVAAGGRVPVFAHVGRASTGATVRLARRAIGTGAAAVSAVVPYYYRLHDEQVLAHYRALVGAAGSTPTLAYNIPAYTGNDLQADAVRTLAADGVAGIKDSTKSLDRHREYLQLSGPRFAVFMGSDGMVADALRAGAAGCVSAVANVRPDLLVRLVRAITDGEADALQAEVSVLRAKVSRGPALLGLKRALAGQLARYPAAVRPPLG